MKHMNDRARSRSATAAPAQKIRFHLKKLEERIAPARGGKGTKNCPCLSSFY
jgi:hypothetical protein